MVDSLHLPLDSKILEVGCGTGTTSVALARRGYHVYATDAVRAMIEQTRQSASENSVNARLDASVTDVHKLAFPDQLFDLVLAVGVLPWMDSPTLPLREMLRVAKPGAHLILSASNRWRLCHMLDPLCFPPLRPIRWKMRGVCESLGLCRASDEPRHTLHSLREFDALILAAGAQKLQGVTVGFGPFTFLTFRLFSESTDIRIHRYLQNLANRGTVILRSTGEGYVVLARKFQAESSLRTRN
jgi:ubiquinone/menaquinone biosynthesis C-methylase UbiE